MEITEAEACIKVAACVCARDGLLSLAEEEMIFKLVTEKWPTYQKADFNRVIDEFFDSTDQIEDYISKLLTEESRKFSLHLSKVSASADGLEIRENIALEKAYILCGLPPNE
tara:strand:- start:441 stop:776 length:336 start_codon:yes stop_codon:yes gene_type:complete